MSSTQHQLQRTAASLASALVGRGGLAITAAAAEPNRYMSARLRFLIAYYGLLQSAHGIALLRAGVILLRGGEMPFPAPPPAGGWSPQTLPFLLGMGVMDGVNIVLALVFAVTFWRSGQLRERLGVVTSTAACASALSFAVATGLSGAWLAHPWAYGLMGVLFIPVAGLFAVLLRAD